MRRHTKEKPYSCDQCHQPFANRGGLKVHIRNKHEMAPKQSCPMKGCEKTFSTIGNMKVSPINFDMHRLKIFDVIC